MFTLINDIIKEYLVPLSLLTGLVSLYEHIPIWIIILLSLLILGYSIWRVTEIRKQLNVLNLRAADVEYEAEQLDSLIRALNFPSELKEKDFTFHTVRRHLFVDGNDAELTVVEEGQNTSDVAINKITRLAFADNTIRFEQLEFKAWHKINGQESDSSITPDELDGARYKVEIGFKNEVVQPGGTLWVKYKFRWPLCLVREKDYWVFPPIYYANPIHNFTIEVCFSSAPKNIGFFKTTQSGREPMSIDQKSYASDHEFSQLTCFEKNISNPNGVYLFRWERAPAASS